MDRFTRGIWLEHVVAVVCTNSMMKSQKKRMNMAREGFFVQENRL